MAEKVKRLAVEVDGDRVLIHPAKGHRDDFRDAAREVTKHGVVWTETHSAGVALVTSRRVAELAGIVKTSASKRRQTRRSTKSKSSARTTAKDDKTKSTTKQAETGNVDDKVKQDTSEEARTDNGGKN